MTRLWETRTCLAVLSSLLFLSPAKSQQASFTLESIMSAPFPEGLIAAPSGGKVAWVQYTRGIRNIWVAEPPEYRGRQVTQYTKDEGQELLALTWTPDAKTIVYVCGGGGGEAPNPTSDPAGSEQSLWRISVAGGDPVRIGPGNSPAISPRGDRVAFIRDGQIFSAPLDSGKEPAQLIRARGGASSLRWSPDGSKLAFVSGRTDYSIVGMYDSAANTVRFLEPSVDRDVSPAWSPDGAHIAFIRIPSGAVTLNSPIRQAQPWSIIIADTASGKARTVWCAAEGVGSVFLPVIAEDQLLWSADDRLVFPWEGDGWIHLYSVPAKGGTATLLTPGAFEVEDVALSPDRRQLLFSSNQDDVDRRHLWRVDAGGGRPAPVTRGKGIEWSPAATSDGKAVVFLRSDARRPARAAIMVGSAEARELCPGSIPPDFPANSLTEPEQVIFSSADGMKIHGQLFLPPNATKGERRPAVIFLHGGSNRQMLLGWHYMYYYHNAYALNQYLAGLGYVVLSVNYRSGIGYGMEFRKAVNFGASGASEFNDVLGAGMYLRNRPDVDEKRIGLWGGSYGGYLTALGLARASDLFAAGVDLHGVHDWSTMIAGLPPGYNPPERSKDIQLAFQSSPLASVDTWRSPVLLIHGDDDRNVPFNQTVKLVQSLRQRKVEVEQLIFPDEIHDFLTHAHWLEAYHAAVDFFDRRLKRRE